MLKRGELAAVVSVAAKPVAVVADFDPQGRFHLVPVPYGDAVADQYLPADLTKQDYPRLVDGDSPVNTLAVGTILAAYNWPEKTDRYQRIVRFIDAFFSKIDDFARPPRHPKWKEVNLTASVTGWKRFPAAQQWLDKDGPSPTATASTRGDFQRFLNETRPAVNADRDLLYQEFLKWRGTR
jgi:hypothetical protein